MLEEKRDEVFAQIILERESNLVKKSNHIYNVYINYIRSGLVFSKNYTAALEEEVKVIGSEVRVKIVNILLGMEKANVLSNEECLKYVNSLTTIGWLKN